MIFKYGCFVFFIFSMAHGALFKERDQSELPFGTVMMHQHLHEGTFEPGSPPQAGHPKYVALVPSAQGLKKPAVPQVQVRNTNSQAREKSRSNKKKSESREKRGQGASGTENPPPPMETDDYPENVLDAWVMHMEL